MSLVNVLIVSPQKNFENANHVFCQTPLQLANPTELQLDGVGVDFVFPCHNNKKEGRNNPHRTLTRRNVPTYFKFGAPTICVWKMSEGCPKDVWRVFEGYLDGSFRVSGENLEGV